MKVYKNYRDEIVKSFISRLNKFVLLLECPLLFTLLIQFCNHIVYFGKDKKIIERRQKIKRRTLLLRKRQNLTPDNQNFNKNNLALLNTIS